MSVFVFLIPMKFMGVSQNDINTLYNILFGMFALHYIHEDTVESVIKWIDSWKLCPYRGV